ncbi:MAG: DsrE family protein [Pseudomonadota bacterium]
MKKFLAILTAVLAIGALQGNALAADKHKVVYHVNGGDEKQHMATLRNIQNHINAVGKDNLDLRVVMHGNGLDLVQSAKKNNDIASNIDKLKIQGVAFNVCGNTLKGKKLDAKKDLYDVSQKDIVPSGVAEIAILQNKGFAYIKP